MKGGIALGVYFLASWYHHLAAEPANEPTGAAPQRVTHYAVVSTGPALGERLERLYWEVNATAYRVLRNYGYPHEAIYRFSERGRGDARSVDGVSSLANLRATFAHLARITEPGDDVLVVLVGHGRPWEGDFVTLLGGGELNATEFGELVDALPARNITLVIHPCYSGGFLPKLSKPGRVVVTSTNDQEENAVPWAEAFLGAFAPESDGDLDGDGRVSILEAYAAGLRPGRERYGAELKEHPLLDDNGDGKGTFGELPREGDGEVATARFLGDEGKPLKFSREAVEALARANGELKLR